MSSDLEQRLEAMLADAPEPDPGAGEKAMHRALHSLQPVARSHRGLRTAVLVFAAVVMLLVIAAGSLAAAGALHVSFGAKAKPRRPAVQLTLPRGADGITAIVDGRLAMVTKSGFRLQGLPVSAAALSPHAFFVAAGIGNSLVAMAPNGRRAWSHPTGGKVVAIAWAPDGYRIAYIVHVRHRFVLHTIYGNGIHDTPIDRSVRTVPPSWRADSLAFAYVGGGGKAIVYDIGHQSRQLLAVSAPTTGLSFAPTGHALAVENPDGVSLVNGSLHRKVTRGPIEAFGWVNGRLAVAARGSSQAHGIVTAMTPKLVIVRRGSRLFAGHTTLLIVPRTATVSDVQVG